MIGLALALVALGIILILFLPWAGIPIGAAGLILFVLHLSGFSRRAAAGRP